ncbi:MAG: hypothetical protein BGO67_06280 [Alphaproteobacteria bacterium 41-28]|nr:MAG: hypothetical protein BGO67_06280 [Alphaproteobacteria bacterium 41-28]
MTTSPTKGRGDLSAYCPTSPLCGRGRREAAGEGDFIKEEKRQNFSSFVFLFFIISQVFSWLWGF